MATNIPYFYKGKNLASLAAKSRNHQLGVTYIDPERSKYLNFTPDDSSKHRFIPYNPGKITDANGNNIWGGTKAAFSPSFDSKAESGYDQLNNVAAWGSAPIPARRAFGTSYNNRTTETAAKYTTTSFIELPTTLTLSWNSSTGITRSDTGTVLTKASCIIIDVNAGGGTGGTGYYGGSGMFAKHSGGGGGGAGAAASLCIDMSSAKKITFTNSAGTITIKNSGGTPFLTLNKGGNGGNGGSGYTRGTGGSGGTCVTNTTAPVGVKVLWTATGAAGGAGGNNNGTADDHPIYGWSMFGYGRKGGDGPRSINFINANIITWYGGGLDKTSSSSSGAGGGGGGSIFAPGTAGMNEMFRNQDRVAQYGAGGGGGCGCNSSSPPAHGWTAGWSGGGAAMCVHFETETDRGYGTEALNTTSSQLTPTYDSRDKDPGWNGENGGGSSGTGCVFPGTQIALDETQSVDIVDYEPRSPLAYCNHDTLEYSIQRSPAKLIYRKATQKVTLTLEDGKTIALTPNHAIFTKDGLKQYLATETTCGYVVGDEIATVDGYKKLTSIVEETIEPTAVYNIITETNFMVANGIIIAGELNFDLAAAEERAAQKARSTLMMRSISPQGFIGPGNEGSKEIM